MIDNQLKGSSFQSDMYAPPPKKWLGNFKQPHLEERRVELERMLSCLLEDPNRREDEAFLSFLGLHEYEPTPFSDDFDPSADNFPSEGRSQLTEFSYVLRSQDNGQLAGSPRITTKKGEFCSPLSPQQPQEHRREESFCLVL